jgi:hypothetical protein
VLLADPVIQDVEAKVFLSIMFYNRKDGDCHMLTVSIIRCIYDIQADLLFL